MSDTNETVHGVAPGVQDGEGCTSPTEPAETVPAQVRAVVRSADGRFAAGSGKPKRRRGGGQAGNLNRSRSPWWSLLRRGRVRTEFQWVLPLIAQQERALLAHVGGAQASAAEVTLVQRAATLHGCALLLTAALASAEEPASVMEDLARVVKLEASLLQALGLKARTAEAPSLASYLKARVSIEGPASAVQAALAGRAPAALPQPAPQLPQETAEDAVLVHQEAGREPAQQEAT